MRSRSPHSNWRSGPYGTKIFNRFSLENPPSAGKLGIGARLRSVTMLVTAGIYGASALVTFALLKERARPQTATVSEAGVKASLVRLKRTWDEASSFPDFSALLACSVAYQAGISVVIALAAVYAEQVLGFKQTETMMLIFLVNIAAAIGAFAWGYVQDRIGHRPALAVTLTGWIVMTVLAALATGPGLFWVAAVIAGLCLSLIHI